MIKLATETDAALLSLFDEMKGKGATGLRQAAWESFAAKGLPNRRVEAWHYTDLKAALAKPAPIASVYAAALTLPAKCGAIRLVTLDGVFRPDLSDLAALPEGVKAQPLREALGQGAAGIMALIASSDVQTDDAALSLNAALMQDGVVLRVAGGATLEQTIELATFVSSEEAQSSFSRNVVIVGKDAHATIVETAGALSSAPAQDNQALIVRLASGATLDIITHASGQSDALVRVMSLLAHLDEGASLNSYALLEGAGLLRRQIFARLDGERAKVSLNGATLAKGRQHVDTTLVVDHAFPNGESRERFRSILDEQGTGVFQGKIVVRPGAQKTDGVMQSKAVLLSDGATMNNKPELEIFADDVQCGHGATCGRLDKDQLFYLVARGIPRVEAEALLIEGFANEAFEGLENEALRGFLATRISSWMAARAR
ncbi:Fe-S cluster assembly protein SufD [Methylocystis parvus]|uniref:Fe-S cluster assembly protein SufD n=1 Tax=Methylocystis parvus TaxID=134 RepID=A0A6B8MAD7_9HYPH|nr:Fe-S cluster assembly protein SufD [Methylocystis parvus]QGM98712.1 Fe-S cluster assembly protein SufD [Methylocystis parvus]WBK00939.1 Fe-S cluster assembly protein SufD [Methylocystis parvus OBBP]